MLAEAGESVIIYGKMSSVPTWAERPLNQEEPLLQKKHNNSQITVCKCNRDNTLIFYLTLYCGLMNLKLNILAIITAAFGL